MGGRWLDTKLGEVLTLQRGFDLPASDRRPGRFPVVASMGVVGTHCEPMVKGPGVVIGRSGSLGGAQYVTDDFWPLNTTLWVKDFKGNDRRFCYYLLKSLNLQTLNVGSGVPTLNRNHVHPLPVRIPADVSEQRAIAHILGAFDDKIELNRRMNETLEAMARALFKSWFIDFDPVHAKAEGDNSGLFAAVDALFPSSFQESESGQVPDGWSSTTLTELALLNSETWSRATYLEAVNYVDLSNAKWGHLESVVTYEKASAPSRAQRVLRPGDSIVGTVRPGNGSYALVANGGLTGSTGFAVLRPRKKIYRDFVYLAATNPENIDRLAHLADGGAYPAVLPNIVLATRITRPNDSVLSSFSYLVAPTLDRIAACDSESRILASIRDTLLPRLISGKVDLSKWNLKEDK